MGEFALGQPVPRFEDPAAVARRRPLCRRHGTAAHGLRLCAALAACACAHPLDRHGAAKAAPGVLAVLTGADWAGLGLGRSAGAAADQAARRLAAVPAALSGAGQGPGALGRRLRRLRRRRDHAPGGGRRRADRGRLRAAARGRLDRRRVAPGAPLVWDDCPDNICFCPSRGRQGGDRRRLRQRRACRQARNSSSTA